MIRNATSQLSEAMKSELVTTVEPEANKKSQESMRGQSVEIDTATAMRIRSRFMRNKTRRQVNKMYQDTANFFGSAAGFLGFGKGQEGGD